MFYTLKQKKVNEAECFPLYLHNFISHKSFITNHNPYFILKSKFRFCSFAMDSDSISNNNNTKSSSSPISVVSRCNNKKKKTNRSAKLKQCKLDARREQWLSQAESKRLNGEGNGQRKPSKPALVEKKISLESLEMNNHHTSDWDSPANSLTSGCSILGGSDTVTNYSGSSSSSTNGSSSSHGCCSGSITEEEQDDGCLDDWEAVADALAAYDKEQNSGLEPPPENVSVAQVNSSHDPANQASSGGQGKKESARVRRAQAHIQAWRPDDVFRPQTLPNLTKQNSFPMKSKRHGRGGGIAWTGKTSQTVPSSCPICCEDLDMTDTNFLPCQCGFRLCLFCHKRILEDDGRCPGCRQAYSQEPVEGEAVVNEGIVTFHLARSCSMIARS